MTAATARTSSGSRPIKIKVVMAGLLNQKLDQRYASSALPVVDRDKAGPLSQWPLNANQPRPMVTTVGNAAARMSNHADQPSMSLRWFTR